MFAEFRHEYERAGDVDEVSINVPVLVRGEWLNAIFFCVSLCHADCPAIHWVENQGEMIQCKAVQAQSVAGRFDEHATCVAAEY